MKYLLCLLLLGVPFAPALAADIVLDADWQATGGRHDENPARFAQAVTVRAASLDRGQWSRLGTERLWRIAVRAPGATSMSLHADAVLLPPGARLWIGGIEHTEADIGAAGLWSRTVPGELLAVEARMPAGAESGFFMHIAEVFAGFRAAPGVPSAARSPGCEIVNYDCGGTPESADAANAVAAYTINGAFACTATLVNNRAQDFRPLMLSAAHCFADAAPEFSAQTVVVYWNAVSPCGGPLQSASSAASHSQSGARHVTRVDESWLFELNSAPPPGANPYWSGFDATDDNPGPSINIAHGGFDAKQVVYFKEAPVKQSLNGTTLGSLFVLATPAWYVDSAWGHTIGGSSGSSLFDRNFRTIGTLYGGGQDCDSDSSADASESSVFQRLAHSWDGRLPLFDFASHLDPAGTGQRVMSGSYNPARRAAPGVALSAGPARAGLRPLRWQAQGYVVQCMASGAWAGARPAAGTELVDADIDPAAFVLSCFSEGDTPTTVRGKRAPAGAAAGGGGALGLWWWAAGLLLLAVRRGRPE